MTKNIPKVITIILTVFIMVVMFGFQANAASELNNNSSLSSSRIALGSSVTITASASGGEGGYTYQYSYAAPGTSTFVTLKSYSSVSSYSFSPTIAGTYTIRVSVKSGSTVKNKDITLNVVKVTNTSTINTASVTVGQSISVLGSATGGTSPYTYKYTYKDASGTTKYISGSDYISSSSVNFKPAQAGTYTIYVVAKDKNGIVSDTKNFTITVNATTSTSLVNNSTVSASTLDLATQKDIIVTYAASGGAGDYSYKSCYQFEGDSSPTYLQGSASSFYKFPSSSTTYSDVVSLDKVGTYTFTISVKDVAGKITTITKTVKTTSSFNLNFKIDKTTCTYADTLTITPSTTGATNQYKWYYTYEYDDVDGTHYTKTVGVDGSGKAAINYSDSEKFNLDDYVGNNFIGTIKFTIHAEYLNIKPTQEITVKVEAPVAAEFSRSELNTLIQSVDTWIMGLSSSGREELYAEYASDDPITEFWETYYDANEAVHGGTDYTTPYINLVNTWTTVKALNLGNNVPFITDAANALITWWGEMLNGIQNLFTDFDTGFDMQGFVDAFAGARGVITIFASSLIVLFFAVNLLESTIQYQLFTIKGAANVFGRLLLAETWVNLSVQICMMVIQIFNELTSSLVNTISSSGLLDGMSLTFQASKSGTWLVGDIVDFFYNLIPLIVFSAILLFMLGVWGTSYIKLTIRSIELGMMTILSPAFFACLTGETTKQYFRKFLMTFIGIVAEILFMALVFGAYCYWLGKNMTEVGLIIKVDDLYSFNDNAKFYIQYVIITVACGVMMVKPPVVLKSLVNG